MSYKNNHKSMNGNLRPVSRQLDPLDGIEDAIADGETAAADLSNYDDAEEPTGRHEVTVNLNGPHPSQHEIDAPPPTKMDVTMTVAKRLPPMALAIVVGVLGLAAIAAWAFLKWQGKL